MLKKKVGEAKHAEGNTNVYKVHCVSLPDLISDTTTHVKLDCEGSEVEMLQKMKAEQWRNVQLLMVEYSSAQEIKDHGSEKAMQRFKKVLRNLDRAGFTHIHIPHEVMKLKRWQKGHNRDGVDFVFWACRGRCYKPEELARIQGKHFTEAWKVFANKQ